MALVLTTIAPVAVADEAAEVTHDDLLHVIRELESRVNALELVVDTLQSDLNDLRQRLDLHESTVAEDAQAAELPRSEPRDNAAQGDTSAWTSFGRGWEYRNVSYDEVGFGTYQFLAEIRRTGDSVETAMFTVTLYSASGDIISTASGFATSMARGDVKTIQFLLQGDPSNASSFRLQVDVEI